MGIRNRESGHGAARGVSANSGPDPELLRRALEELRGGGADPGFTAAEFAEVYGKCIKLSRDALKALIAQGKARASGKREVTRIDGSRGLVPVYVLEDA